MRPMRFPPLAPVARLAPLVPLARALRAAAGSYGCIFYGSLLIVCGGGEVTGPGSVPPPFAAAGSYAVTETDGPSLCAPVPDLPAPAVADWPSYDWARDGFPVKAPFALRMGVTQADSTITLVALDANGQATDFPFVGTVGADGRFQASRSRTIEEGPRAGGHRFTVASRVALSGTFTRGQRGSLPSLDATATGTDDFHTGGAGGPLFTTCTYQFGWTAG